MVVAAATAATTRPAGEALLRSLIRPGSAGGGCLASAGASSSGGSGSIRGQSSRDQSRRARCGQASSFQPQRHARSISSAAAGTTRARQHGVLRGSVARPSLSMRPMYGGSLAAAGALQARGLSLWPSSSAPSDSAAAAATTAAEEGAATSSSALPDVAAAQGHGVNEGVSAAGEAVAAQAADGIVNFSDIALSWWPNVKAAQIVTDWVVESTGLPWWANIALVTVGVRILVLPLILRGQANAIRLGNIQPQMQAMIKDMSYAKASGDRALQQDSAARVQKLMADNDCHPMRSLIAPLVQGPIFISFFCALRSFAEQGLTPMKTGGLAWFPDLTSADPNGILPVISAASMLLILETGAEMGGSTQQNTPQAKMTRNVLRGVSVIMIPFIWSFPAAVFCYWLTNNTFSLVQLMVLRIPAVRRALKLPEKIKPNAADDEGDVAGRGKPMGFWDSIAAGKDTQTAAGRPLSMRGVGRNGMPSVLQEQRRVEETRERALQKMMRASGSTSSAESNASADAVLQGSESVPGPVGAAAAAPAPAATPLVRKHDKHGRVQAARERRQRRRA